jgi:hypothetical protein
MTNARHSLDRLPAEAVDSVGAIELLVLMRSLGGRAQEVGELCAALGSPRSWTLLQLDKLVGAGLIERGGDDRWRYAPSTTPLAGAVEELAEAWERDPSTVRRWAFPARRPPRRRDAATRSRPS